MNKFFIYLFASALYLTGFNGYGAIIFSDDFDAETGSGLNYNSFSNWNVTDGTVDLIANGNYGLLCYGGAGKCVDMDGSTSNAGTLTTMQAFTLIPGTYVLTFAISGNKRNAAADSMTVSLGSLFTETFTKSASDPYEMITRTIDVFTTQSASLSFAHAGGDNLGIMLDNVTLASVPVPSAI